MQYTGERIIPAYEENAAQGNVDIHDLMYREFLVTAGDKDVLDIACGCGMGTKMIAERAVRVHGYDIDSESIEFAKKYYNAENIKYDVGDICKISEPDASFDSVISVETFEHVENLEGMISEIYRVLKQNGIWCFTTPNGDRYPDHKIVKYHIKHYTESKLYSILDSRFSCYVRRTGLEPDTTIRMGRPMFGNYSVFCLKR